MKTDKPYFAKYLLIDSDQSDLKNGDLFFWKDEVHKFHSSVGYGIKTYTEFNKKDDSSVVLNWSNFIGKAKLHLCSNDIQINDEVLHLPDTNPKLRFKVLNIENGVADIEYITHPENKFIGHKREWLVSNLFKVLGELSPYAKWVKDGDKFSELNIFPEYDYTAETNFVLTGRKLAYYKVRCSQCETFH